MPLSALSGKWAACSAAGVATTVVVTFWFLRRRSHFVRSAGSRDAQDDDKTKNIKSKKSAVGTPVAKVPPGQPRPRDKASERLEWWQRLNNVKPELTLPPLENSGKTPAPTVYNAVVQVATERLRKGKDWLVRDSDYGDAPAHSAVKAKVNAALLKVILDEFGMSLTERLGSNPSEILLLLDTPHYGTLREFVGAFPNLRCCQQVVIPQADLRHYFEMVRGSDFYPGVRAQRLDHWLCANSQFGFRCLATFLDYECRLVGSLSARLCPAADIMRYFRFGYPASPVSVLALTVGLEEPAVTPEDVDTFVRWEAALNGYEVELKETWKYRMVTLLYVVRRCTNSSD